MLIAAKGLLFAQGDSRSFAPLRMTTHEMRYTESRANRVP